MNPILEERIRYKEEYFKQFRDSGLSTFRQFMEKLYNLARGKEKAKFLELGVSQPLGSAWEGESTTAFLVACSENGSHLTSIDIQDCSRVMERIKKVGLDKYWTFIQDDDRNFLPKCEDIFDIILCDTIEDYDHVSFELEQSNRLLNEKGIILVHDLRVKSLYEAILDFLQRHPNKYSYEEYWVCYGLGILRRLGN